MSEFQQVREAINNNNIVGARKLLVSILRSDPQKVDAWLLLAEISDDNKQRKKILEKTLLIAPNNEEVQNALNVLELDDLFKSTEPSPKAVTSVVLNGEQPDQSPSLLTEDNPGETMLDLANVKQPESKFKKITGRWEYPFRGEQDVISHFSLNIDELLNLTKDFENEVKRQIGSLNYSKEKYDEVLAAQNREQSNSNIYLAPAVNASVEIAKVLEQAGQDRGAFWIANIFGEMCKILVARRRDKYQKQFEELLKIACFAVSNEWISDAQLKKDSNSNEITHLKKKLDNLCSKRALRTYFNRQSNEFVRAGRPDMALAERVINVALGRHFDQRLRDLLQHDRPRVKQYVTENMPIIFQLKLPERLGNIRREWEQLLISEGYEDTIRFLKSMGDLVSIDELGQLSSERLEDVRRAATSNNLLRVSELLNDSADELKRYLYEQAQAKLDYRQPKKPYFKDGRLWNRFKNVMRLSETDDPDKLNKALDIAQSIWKQDINNTNVRDWVAYLQAKNRNLQAAEQLLEQIRRRRGNEKQNFTTNWNLAVLTFDRKDVATAYRLLVPLLNVEIGDEDLILVVLALSLQLNEQEMFLNIIPRTMSLKFHPLAITVANDLGDEDRAQEFLADFLRQTDWQLPSVGQRFASLEALEKVVNQAIVEGQIDQLVSWLRARISQNRRWVPNYLALARILEYELLEPDIDSAFDVLRNRLMITKKEQFRVDQACRDLLSLCKRAKRDDLGRKAYRLSIQRNASNTLLDSFHNWAPTPEGEPEQIDVPPPLPRQPPIEIHTSSFTDPKLAEQLMWVTARFTKIRDVSTYVKESEALNDFGVLLAKLNPKESGRVVELINSISTVIGTFLRSDPDDHDSRRVLYDRATGYEESLARILKGETLSSNIANVIVPYHAALKQVIGDLSRQAGIGPNLQATIENLFYSLEVNRSTLVLRIANESERPVTNVMVELLVEDSFLSITGKQTKSIASLDPHQSTLLSFSTQVNKDTKGNDIKDITFVISLLASAEGFPNVDLGITKRQVPVKRLSSVIGRNQIPKLFQIGKPLGPSEPELFQGRDDILSQIENSFYAGIQRERYFLDGIRRVGKTSILNFVLPYLPDNLIPVLINLDKFGLYGPINSAVVLRQICALVRDSVQTHRGINIDLPDQTEFDTMPGQIFGDFLATFREVLPDHVPFLMIDEFQDLLEAVSKTGPPGEQDSLVLDLIRGHLDEGNLFALLTGSVRFDLLSGIVEHRIFGSLKRLRVSFLSEDSVSNILHAGMEQWVNVPPETVRKIHTLTGGYPWLVQTYGAGLVDLLNREHRTVATPDDVDVITRKDVLPNNELFAFWWSTKQLGPEEERLTEDILRLYSTGEQISIRDFFSKIRHREQSTFRKAFDNLQACEVFDSTQTEFMQFSGKILQQWLSQQMQDGRLRIRAKNLEKPIDTGQAGIFIDHENLIHSLERISQERGVIVPSNKVEWFSNILKAMLIEAERRVGALSYKITVAFWSNPKEAQLLSAYFSHGFTPAQPVDVKKENAVDFSVADEARRASEQARKEGTRLNRAIIVTGDGDLSHVTRSLKNDGVNVQIWGGSQETNAKFASIVGHENVVALDDVSGL